MRKSEGRHENRAPTNRAIGRRFRESAHVNVFGFGLDAYRIELLAAIGASLEQSVAVHQHEDSQ